MPQAIATMRNRSARTVVHRQRIRLYAPGQWDYRSKLEFAQCAPYPALRSALLRSCRAGLVILDVAHNPHAARSLAQNLAGLPPCPHTWAVFAMIRDKDMAGVAAALDPYIDTWLVAGIDAPRGAAAGELAQVLQNTGVRGDIQTFPDVGEALRYAYNAAGENDRIAAFGSFYTVAEAMAAKGLKF